MKNKILFTACALLFSGAAMADGARVDLGEFSKGSLTGWESKSFAGTTQYQLEQQGNKQVLKANSNKTASIMGRRMRIDLTKTPFLNWSWKIDKALPPLKEATRAGDDYAARVYVIIDGGVFVWKTRALNYVWSSAPNSRGTKWNNAFKPKNARMLAVRDKRDAAGRWLYQKQDVAADFKTLFGFQPRFIDGIAIMTDTDNSGGTAAASYGDIFFSEK